VGTQLSVRLRDSGVSQDLRRWANSALMTLVFLVVGLEARREFDMDELRERRRLALPLVAGIAGMAVPVAIYLAANAGGPAAYGWGVVMSTDTAFALGMLALVGRRFPARLRAYLLTVTVVDDVVALAVITTVYSGDIALPALLTALGILGVIMLVGAGGVGYGPVYALLGTAAWVAMNSSGVEPIVVGLAMGLLTYAYPAARGDLERATEVFRLFREQPTPELARSARTGVASAISPNERLQQLYHPWTSYVIVPLFGLANAGITISADFLAGGYTSPVTLGILFGYVAGKPIGILGFSWLVTWLSRGRLRPPVGWRPSRAAAPSPASASPWPCWSRHSRSPAGASRGRSSASSPRRCARPRRPGWSSARPRCCHRGCGPARCWARPTLSSTSPRRWTRDATTSVVPRTPRSPWSSTATSSARTAVRRNASSASCSPGTATSGTCVGTCR
jgi:Na+/H+ antiporter NhaA